MNRLILLYVILAVLLLITCSQTLSEYRRDIGVRPLGMGGAFASFADDPTGVFWNPAGISDIHHRVFVYDLSQGALSAACPVSRIGVIGLSIVDMNYTDRFLIDSPLNPFGMFLTGDNQVLLSYAKRFKSGVAFGWNIGYNCASDPESLWAVSFDFGVDVQLSRRFSAGMSVRDINGTRIYNSYGDLIRRFDRQLLFGINVNPHRSFRFSIALNPDRGILRSGAELRWRWLSFRIGAIERFSRRIEKPILTAGISLNLGNKKLNYAYISDPEMRYQHLLSVQFDFVPPSPKGGFYLFKDLFTPELGPKPAPKRLNPRETIKHRKVQITFDLKPKSKNEMIEIPSTKIVLDSPPMIDPPMIDLRGEESKFKRMAERYGLDPILVLALIKVESNFNPTAVSPAGAAGLMQLMPSTARILGLMVPRYKNPKRPNRDPKVDERFDPVKNLEAGMRYLKEMMEKYSNNYVLAICAYNSGPSRVKDDIPAIRQTERFAAEVMKQYYDYQSDPAKLRSDMLKIEEMLH